MINRNRYSSWYGSYRTSQQKNAKSPYKIMKIEHDMGVPIPGLEEARLEAFSPAQARVLFLRKYPKLQDYLSMGYQVEAELDGEMLRQRKQIADMEKKRVDEFVQDAWWNK